MPLLGQGIVIIIKYYVCPMNAQVCMGPSSRLLQPTRESQHAQPQKLRNLKWRRLKLCFCRWTNWCGSATIEDASLTLPFISFLFKMEENPCCCSLTVLWDFCHQGWTCLNVLNDYDLTSEQWKKKSLFARLALGFFVNTPHLQLLNLPAVQLVFSDGLCATLIMLYYSPPDSWHWSSL